jgi:hypothetical protein
VRQVGEAGIEGDGTDRAADTTWIREHLVRGTSRCASTNSENDAASVANSMWT